MMSAFEIRIKKKALKFISDLGSKEKVKLRDAFIKLKENPVPVKSLDIVKLSGKKNVYRIRIGRVRVLYEVLWREKIILVHRVDFRGEIYKP